MDTSPRHHHHHRRFNNPSSFGQLRHVRRLTYHCGCRWYAGHAALAHADFGAVFPHPPRQIYLTLLDHLLLWSHLGGLEYLRHAETYRHQRLGVESTVHSSSGLPAHSAVLLVVRARVAPMAHRQRKDCGSTSHSGPIPHRGRLGSPTDRVRDGRDIASHRGRTGSKSHQMVIIDVHARQQASAVHRRVCRCLCTMERCGRGVVLSDIGPRYGWDHGS